MTERGDTPRGEQKKRGGIPEFSSFEQTANGLGIPQELWEQPAVRDLITLANGLENHQTYAALLQRHSPNQRLEGMPALSERYDAVDMLLRASLFILEDGFNETEPLATSEPRRRYLKRKVSSALRSYGMEVIDAPLEEEGASSSSRAHEGGSNTRSIGYPGETHESTRPQLPTLEDNDIL